MLNKIAIVNRLFTGLIIFLLVPLPAIGQQGSEPVENEIDTLATVQPAPSAEEDSLSFEPYSTDRSFMYHVLSTPAYIIEGLTRPIGPVIQFVSDLYPKIFPIRINDFIINPMIEFGGQNPVTFSADASNSNIWDTGNTLQLQLSISSTETNDFQISYKIEDYFSKNDRLTFNAQYGRDASRRYFPGNDFPQELERFFDEEVFELGIDYHNKVSDLISYELGTGFHSSEVGQGDFSRSDPVRGDFFGEPIDEFRVVEGDTLLLFPNELKDIYGLLDFNAGIEFDFTEPGPRQHNTSRFKLHASISRSINNADYGYFDYRIEYNQFLPIFFKPDSRRLALKTVLHKAQSFDGKDIPFFRQPHLGDENDLRGFQNNRFRNDGALIYTIEYRYLIWPLIDGLLFIDQGQVFKDFNDIGLDDFHTDFGFGFHLLNENGVSVRWEFAFSEENNRTVLAVGKSF